MLFPKLPAPQLPDKSKRAALLVFSSLLLAGWDVAACAQPGLPSKGDRPAEAKQALDKAKSYQISSKAIDKLLAKRVGNLSPGALVTVSLHGNPLFQKAYGYADLKSKELLSKDTIFDLASCSKQFTALATLMLVEHGLLKLDDPLSKHLAEFRADKKRPVTVRQLLNMSSGLADYSELLPAKSLARIKPAELVLWTARQKRNFAPAEKWQYNNGNYAILAYLIERLSKKTFAEFMQEKIFKPLNMNDTLIMSRPGMNIKKRASGYTEKRGAFILSRNDTYIVGDGQLMTSATDFAKWDKALSGNFRLLSPELLKQAAQRGRLASGKTTDYGFGFSLEPYKGKDCISHEGNWNGSSTFIGRFPESGISIMVLSNNDCFGAGEAAEQIADSIFFKP